jgi:uncharacterized protein (TIGR03032 family)
MTTSSQPPNPAGNEERAHEIPPPYTGPKGQPTEIRFSSSESLPSLLENSKCSVFISTYLIGNLITVGVKSGHMLVSFHTFDRPMGMTLSKDGIVVCTRSQVWFMPGLPDIGQQMAPRGQYDTAYFARRSHQTGNILCHEIGWVGKELWIVNTRFSCLCTLHPSCHFAPRWKPPFITALVPEDRCHLNGLATANGMARYVTALAETDSREGWRKEKAKGGCLIDVVHNTIVSRGFAMPHSPRLANGKLYILHSGLGRLEVVDPANGKRETVCELPGYTRGLSIHGSLAFVGLSKIRESSSMDGVPIASNRDLLKCGVWVVDLMSGAIVGNIEFTSGFDELFDVQVLAGITSPFVSGPLVDHYSEQTFWTLPQH